jgi:hypothetical protein
MSNEKGIHLSQKRASIVDNRISKISKRREPTIFDLNEGDDKD